MLFKSKGRKIQEIIEKKAEISKSKISEIVDSYQEMEIFNAEKIGSNIRFNYPRVYFYNMCNLAEDIVALIENERYSSIYTLYECFLRNYGMCKELMSEACKDDENQYSKVLRKYYSATLYQRKSECENFCEEYVNSYEEEINFFRVRFNQMESIIREFFTEYGQCLSEENSDEVYEIVEKINAKYGIAINQETLAIKALIENDILDDDEKRKAILTFISGRSATESNIQTVITRVLGKVEGNTALMLNKDEKITTTVLIVIEGALRDISKIVENHFDI